MNREDYKIHIVGAGISGLIAAKTLEKNGYHPTVIEATNNVGGRVKTDIVEDYQLDHGFQVLLNAYPKAKEHLDFETLELQEFLPGSIIFSNGKTQTIGDPLRNLSFLFPTVFSSIGSFNDKIKTLRLNQKLKKKSIQEIFSSPETSSLDYLKEKGFSGKVIDAFFKPFFSGIFLESDLKTSSRMLEFVYKMFGDGLAVLPKGGIGKIAEQLKSQLEKTDFIFNKEVVEVGDRSITLSDGTLIDTHFTIITSGANQLIGNLNNQDIAWKSCYNLYFEVDKRTIDKPIIGLVADKDALINNLFFHNSLATATKGDKELLSVTVVKDTTLNKKQLIQRVTEELLTKCGIVIDRHLKTYHITKALPDINGLQNDISPTETQLKPTIFLAGDYLLNGSLNAAMISGERAAQGVIMSLEDGIVVDHIASEYV